MVAACAASCTTVSSDRPVFSLMLTRLPSLEVLPGASGLSRVVTSTNLTLTPLTSTTAANLPAMRRATWLLLFSEMLVSTAASLLPPSRSTFFADRGVSFGPEVPRIFPSNSPPYISPSDCRLPTSVLGAVFVASVLAPANSVSMLFCSAASLSATACFRTFGSSLPYPATRSLMFVSLALKSSTFFWAISNNARSWRISLAVVPSKGPIVASGAAALAAAISFLVMGTSRCFSPRLTDIFSGVVLVWAEASAVPNLNSRGGYTSGRDTGPISRCFGCSA